MASVQDLGRKGWLQAGVSGAGPMDPPSFRIANALVGNEPNAAALEFAGIGGRFQVSGPVRFAVTGGDMDIRRGEERLHAWESHDLCPGEVLTIGALRGCVWGYLALSGGIDVPPVMGSRSTHLRSGIGGHAGRRLQAGDRLPLGRAAPAPLLALRRPLRQRPAGTLRVVPGPQDDRFGAEVLRLFLSAPFILSSARDRMAQVLDGPVLAAGGGHDIVSDGTCAGSIQVPASGRPLVLMAERQTTGGYPKIATLASVDLPGLAQRPTGRHVRFRAVSQAEAEDALIVARAELGHCLDALEEKRPPRAKGGMR
ncbi:allophanate hydrolase [Aureimonas ureilytica]|uniref:Allophanate hydrolase n=2 Tax=Aureimonas ureilytica TaxID=401562 RepID=A0A175RRD5_9HYPH|nr:allophanate hydrolase [Aureimonas ureilytica]